MSESEEIKSESRLNSFDIESGMDAFVIIDSAGVISHTDPAFLDVFGFTGFGEMAGRKLTQFIDIGMPADRIISEIQKNDLWTYDGDIIINDSTVFDGKITAEKLYSRDEDRYKIHVILSAQHESAIDNKRSLKLKQKPDSVLKELPLGYQSLDENGCILDINHKWLEILGYSRDEVIGKWFGDFLTDKYTKHFEKNFAGFKKTGSITDIEFEILRKDGKILYIAFDGQIAYDPDGNFDRTHCVMRDISARKASENSLRESEQNYRATIDAIKDAIHVVNSDLRVIIANPSFRKMCRRLDIVTDPIGKPLRETYPFLDDQVIEEYKQVFTNGKALLTEDRNRIKGKDLISETYKIPILEQGVVSRVLTIIRDISETRKFEKELSRADKMDSIGLLSAGIAHDFNNIISGLMGFVSMAKNEIDPKSKAFGNLEKAEQACSRAQSLTMQLMTFSKSGAPLRKTVLISDIIKKTALFALSGSNVKCHFEIPPDLCLVNADEEQIRQVIHNIVTNAAQAMPNGGVVSITGDNTVIRIGDSRPVMPGGYIKITIEDSGIGIPKNLISRVFEPFFTTSRKRTGLGLTTTYAIVLCHDGHIEIESRVDIGTKVNLYLPATQAHIEQPQPKAGTAVKPTENQSRVLIMDDEEIIRTVAAASLSRFGYIVDKAANGEEAIKKYKAAYEKGVPYNVVILDLTVPGGIGGRDAMKKLREIDPEIRAIVSSGYPNDPIIADYESFGFSGFLVKPYKAENLVKTVSKVAT